MMSNSDGSNSNGAKKSSKMSECTRWRKGPIGNFDPRVPFPAPVKGGRAAAGSSGLTTL
jgi:hypothetical protein